MPGAQWVLYVVCHTEGILVQQGRKVVHNAPLQPEGSPDPSSLAEAMPPRKEQESPDSGGSPSLSPGLAPAAGQEQQFQSGEGPRGSL